MIVMTTIYALKDPRDDSVRYVGATRKKLHARLRDHEFSITRIENKAPRYEWLRQLSAAGLRPLIEQLEVVPEAQMAEAEERWITRHRKCGCDLLNVKRGGGGPKSTSIRNPWTTEQREAHAARMRKRYEEDPELNERVARGTREGMARFLNENGTEYGQRMSASLRRRYKDPAERQKTSAASSRMWSDASIEMRERHSASMRAAVAREQRVKCPSCDMVSRPANIARHRKAKNH